MANQQLVDYIKSQLSLGVMKPDLIKAIQAAGWTGADMDAAFAAAEGRTSTVPPPPIAPASQPAPATIVQPTRPVAVQPTSMQGGSLEPMRPRPTLSSHEPGSGIRMGTVRGPLRSWMLYVLIVLVVVIGFIIYLLPILRPLIFGGLTPSSDASQTQTQGESAVGATIDAASLASQSPTPTLAGTAQGFSTLAVLVGQNVADGGEVTVQNGTWQFTVPQALAPGTYQVVISPVDSATGNLQADIAANKVVSTTLAQGTLTVASSTQAAASSTKP